MRVELLGEAHDRAGFSSDVAPLDHDLHALAGQDVRFRVASCFVLVDGDDPMPLGFYTLAATSIALTTLPEPLAKRLPRYPQVPAALMGRLAVDARHRGRRQGRRGRGLLSPLRVPAAHRRWPAVVPADGRGGQAVRVSGGGYVRPDLGQREQGQAKESAGAK